MNGAEILIDGLIREKVDTIFGYPGGVVIPIFDILYKTDKIKFLLTRHEQGAVHAADGYARATGKVGVSIVTSGPGATNAITGIATAKLDSIPIVVISGQVPSGNIGTDAFQETDMVGLTRTICKHNFLVQSVKELPNIINEAFHIARSGRPGPVTIDIPVDISMANLKDYKYPEKITLPGYKPVEKANPKQIKKLANAIKSSKKPLLYTGGGIVISQAHDELVKLAEKTNIPIVTTLMGLGSVSFDHPLFLGMPGMHGTIPANYAISECDLLIAIGARFDDRITGPRHSFVTQAKVAHIDIDPAEISKNINADIPIVGDAKDALLKLNESVIPREKNSWNDKVEKWLEKYKLHYNQPTDGEILPQYVIDRINEVADEELIVATDVGQHQMWTAQFYHHRKPRKLITSGGLGTMGFGLPAAMGAAYGSPDKTVVTISGDGSIQMNIQELATCAINRIPVKIIVLNNSFLGMVRQWQDMFWDKNYSGTCLKQTPDCSPQCSGPNENCTEIYYPDFVKVAEANGVTGFRVNKPSEVDKVLKKGFEINGPVLMEFIVKEEENVFPMVPAGKKNNEIIMEDIR